LKYCSKRDFRATVKQFFIGSNHRIKVRKKEPINPFHRLHTIHQKQESILTTTRTHNPCLFHCTMVIPEKPSPTNTTYPPLPPPPKAILGVTIADGTQDPYGAGSSAGNTVAGPDASASRKRLGKELLQELGTE
jgi:hypothetical protein